MKKKTKVLFLANIPQADKRSVGGATMLSKKILDFLQTKEEIDLTHYQFRKNWKPKFQIVDFILLSLKLPFIIRKYDVVSIHSTPDMNLVLGPVLVTIAKTFNKKIVYHFFGGNFYNQYTSAPKFIRRIVDNTTFKADFVFFETKQLLNFFATSSTTNMIWLPNSRDKIINKFPKRSFNKKFVFISRVIKEKGIDLILEAFEKLDNSYTVSIYGPIPPNTYSVEELTKRNCSYKGILSEKEVTEVLNENDVLLLPTYFDGEGYPGIIIESLSMAMPVISSDWKAINEIISTGYNGLLCIPKNPDSLLKQILHLNQENYPLFSKNAWESFERFNADKVFNKLLNSYLS